MLFRVYIGVKPPVGKEGFERETWAVGVNSKILGGPKQIRKMLMEESSKGPVLPWIEAMKDIFARCSKKMAIQVCTSFDYTMMP